jgi:NIMA (never in mitosis gene a)-related kinase 2
MATKDQYEVLETIGTGSFGKVRKVRRKTDRMIMVWKEINFGKMSEKEKGQLVAEVNILQGLKNPFIVKYHDRIVDKACTTIYIIMELCSGGDLSKVVSKCKREGTHLEESYVWKVLCQCILALKDCHNPKVSSSDKTGTTSRPILHRDIKPANIMLDSGNNIKIGDFGLAKELSSTTQLAQTNVGTPFYMAPEIMNEKNYDHKSDIWSLGCLVYELAGLRPPFDATNAVSLAVKVNQGRFPRLPARYSRHLSDIITSMLQVDPRRRPDIRELEKMVTSCSPGTLAFSKAKALVLDQTQAAKTKDLRSREAALSEREQSLLLKEKRLSQWEENLARRETDLEKKLSTLNSVPATTRQAARRKSLDGGAMDVETSGDIGKERNVPTSAIGASDTNAGFTIHVDESSIPASSSNVPTHTATSYQKSSADIISGVRRAKQVLAQVNAAPTRTSTATTSSVETEDKENAPPSAFGIFANMAAAKKISGNHVHTNKRGIEGNTVLRTEGQSPFKRARPALGLAAANATNIPTAGTSISQLVRKTVAPERREHTALRRVL